MSQVKGKAGEFGAGRGRRRQRAANRAPEHIGDLLQSVLRRCRQSSDLEMLRLWEIWEDAVGKAIAANAKPAAFKGPLLIVHVASATWAHELQFLKQDLISKINDRLDSARVTEIRFKVGPV